MRKIKLLHVALIGILLLTSCNKKSDEVDIALIFNSLTSSSSSFIAGSSVSLSADVTGANVEYYWSYNSGSISGGGTNVSYSNDEIGYHTVLCTVVDGAGEIEAREIVLEVQ